MDTGAPPAPPVESPQRRSGRSPRANTRAEGFVDSSQAKIGARPRKRKCVAHPALPVCRRNRPLDKPERASSDASIPVGLSRKQKQYVVERLVGKRISQVDGEVEYRVRWHSFTADDDTWEPVSGLRGSKQAIKDFEQRAVVKAAAAKAAASKAAEAKAAEAEAGQLSASIETATAMEAEGVDTVAHQEVIPPESDGPATVSTVATCSDGGAAIIDSTAAAAAATASVGATDPPLNQLGGPSANEGRSGAHLLNAAPAQKKVKRLKKKRQLSPEVAALKAQYTALYGHPARGPKANDIPWLQLKIREAGTGSAKADSQPPRVGWGQKSQKTQARPRPQRPPSLATADDDEADDYCYICADGGDLMCCDTPGCPRVYHEKCLKDAGWDNIPEDDEAKWECPNCPILPAAQCVQCGMPGTSDRHLLSCESCPRAAHARCCTSASVPAGLGRTALPWFGADICGLDAGAVPAPAAQRDASKLGMVCTLPPPLLPRCPCAYRPPTLAVHPALHPSTSATSTATDFNVLAFLLFVASNCARRLGLLRVRRRSSCRG
jgi:hypothetical protein